MHLNVKLILISDLVQIFFEIRDSYREYCVKQVGRSFIYQTDFIKTSYSCPALS